MYESVFFNNKMYIFRDEEYINNVSTPYVHFMVDEYHNSPTCEASGGIMVHTFRTMNFYVLSFHDLFCRFLDCFFSNFFCRCLYCFWLSYFFW